VCRTNCHIHRAEDFGHDFSFIAMVKTILILGGSYAGLHVAHGLLKKRDKDVKVIVVSKVSEHGKLVLAMYDTCQSESHQ
jgi:hypothetical protein